MPGYGRRWGAASSAAAGADLDQRLRCNDPIVGPPGIAPSSRRSGRVLYWMLFLLFIFLLGLGFGILDSRSIRVEQVVVPCAGLRSELNGFSIIQLSDLHSMPGFERNREAARMLDGLQANIAVITGDFRNSGGLSQDAAEGAQIVIQSIRRRMPVYAVQGNNDYPETMKLLQQEGVRVLENVGVPLADGLWLAGWNPYVENHPRLTTVLDMVPRDALIILASHSPDVILEEGFSRARLILAGHTHGIQIRFPGLPSPITLTRVGSRYTRGLYRLEDAYLYINRGIGTTMVPLRVYSAPEVTLLRLQSIH